MEYHYRDFGIFKKNPFRDRLWVIACILACGLQSLWSFLAVYSASCFQKNVPSGVIAFALLWPLGTISLDELVKSHSSTFFRRRQKRLRFEFDTRLGMYSPK